MEFVKPDGQLAPKPGCPARMILATDKMYTDQIVAKRTIDEFVKEISINRQKSYNPGNEEGKAVDVEIVTEIRDTDWFIDYLNRREEALHKFTTVQRAI